MKPPQWLDRWCSATEQDYQINGYTVHWHQISYSGWELDTVRSHMKMSSALQAVCEGIHQSPMDPPTKTRNFMLPLLLIRMCCWWSAYDNALIWMQWDLTDYKSRLVHVMAWCHQATNRYWRQYWPRSVSPYGITRPQRVKGAIHCFGNADTVHHRIITISNFPEWKTWKDLYENGNLALYLVPKFSLMIWLVNISKKLKIACKMGNRGLLIERKKWEIRKKNRGAIFNIKIPCYQYRISCCDNGSKISSPNNKF